MTIRRFSVLLITLTFSLPACTGIVADAEWDDDDGQEVGAGDGERQSAFKHGPPSGAAPWSYFLTCYGGPGDGSNYNGKVACGGRRTDGAWWYATGAWSFGCFSKLELRANGKCAVVQVVDNGPAGWVETKAKNKCGGSGYIIDASPLVTKHLYGKSCSGWSDCLAIQVRPVAANTPTGPCSGGGSTTPTTPTTPSQPSPTNCHNDVAFGWGYCSASCPCSAGQGDCDDDNECAPGLRCAHNVGANYGVGATVDVCEASAPSPSNPSSPPPSNPPPSNPPQSSPPSGGWGSCTHDGRTGVCQSTGSSCNGSYVQWLCPGPNSVQCCVPPAPVASGWGTCSYNGRGGVCQSDSISCAGGYVSNRCPGPNNVRCCLK